MNNRVNKREYRESEWKWDNEDSESKWYREGKREKVSNWERELKNVESVSENETMLMMKVTEREVEGESE